MCTITNVFLSVPRDLLCDLASQHRQVSTVLVDISEYVSGVARVPGTDFYLEDDNDCSKMPI